eukprot:tig00020902_g14946.t1
MGLPAHTAPDPAQLEAGRPHVASDVFVEVLVDSDGAGGKRANSESDVISTISSAGGVLAMHVDVVPKSAAAVHPMGEAGASAGAGQYGRSYITFKDLSFHVQLNELSHEIKTVAHAYKRGGKKRDVAVLDGVSGFLAPGTLTLLLGGPRTGKSTLLKILSGRMTDMQTGKLGGQVLINGSKPDESYRRRVALVEQNDVHYPLLTVRETLRFAGSLRMPGDQDSDAIDRQIDDVLQVLNLKHCADTIVRPVGNQTVRGLSGGERRRLTVAVEAMAGGKTEAAGGKTVLLLDQPSDGLDATSTLELCRSLRRLADGGLAVMACLLQPSWEAFSCFDRVMILAGGRAAYFGPTEGAVAHFQSLGYRAPPGMTPQARPAPPRKKDSYSKDRKDRKDRMDPFDPQARPAPPAHPPAGRAAPAPPAALRAPFARPLSSQFGHLYARFVRLLIRDPGPSISRLVMEMIFLGFVMGTLYAQMPATYRGALNRVAFMQAAVLVFGFALPAPPARPRLALPLEPRPPADAPPAGAQVDRYFGDRDIMYKETDLFPRQRGARSMYNKTVRPGPAPLPGLPGPRPAPPRSRPAPPRPPSPAPPRPLALSAIPAPAPLSPRPSAPEARLSLALQAAGYYRPVAWYAAVIVSEIPRLFFEVVVFACVCYFAGGLQMSEGGARFGKFILALFSMTLTADALILERPGPMDTAVVAWTPAVQIGGVLAAVTPPILLMFNGFHVPKGEIPRAWIWMHYFTFYRYPHEALCINELSGLALADRPEGGDAVLDFFTLNKEMSWYWIDVGIMFGQWIFYMGLGLLGFCYKRWRCPRSAPPCPRL